MIYVLLPAALAFAALAVAVFIWAVRSGQFDDLETPAHRVLHEDEDDPQVSSRDGFEDPSRGGARPDTTDRRS